MCGYHQDQASARTVKELVHGVLPRKFEELSLDPETGVLSSFAQRISISATKSKNMNLISHKMNELRNKVRGFVHDAALIEQTGVSPGIGLKDALQLFGAHG